VSATNSDLSFFNGSEKYRGVRCTSLLLGARHKANGLNLVVLSICRNQRGILGKGRFVIQIEGKSRGSSRSAVWHSPLVVRLIKAHIKYDELAMADIHARINIAYMDDKGGGFEKPTLYSPLNQNKGKGKSRARKVIEYLDSTVYIRQAASNNAYITTRRINKSDYSTAQLKINVAYWLSRIIPSKKRILLYEKESEKYEESAAVLYERLIDGGHKDVYFILDPDSPHNKFVKDKYKKNLLKKHSFKHYIYFFSADDFLGTEVPVHAIDLRIANKYAVRKIHSPKLKYVFLQHGVMYMVSLGSRQRQVARKTGSGRPKNTKTVVSSMLEAEHFIDYGGYDLEDLYITGLPKFDRSMRIENPKRIVIMPTWRPWEYNQIRTSPTSTRYYRMLKEIITSIPDELKEVVQLLPHPLFIREVQNTELNKYIKPFESYDHVLRDTDLLITDYSSIAYDAFYRGANVVFWWKEKEYCMKQYGGFLMINENNIFGDIVKDKKSLKETIKRLYGQPQTNKYKQRYSKIVEFHDNHNTDRLIECLRQDRKIR